MYISQSWCTFFLYDADVLCFDIEGLYGTQKPVPSDTQHVGRSYPPSLGQPQASVMGKALKKPRI